MQYLELTNRELEYVALSRDTTESDLKQRREIQGGTAHYIDQAAVKAAAEGRKGGQETNTESGGSWQQKVLEESTFTLTGPYKLYL